MFLRYFLFIFLTPPFLYRLVYEPERDDLDDFEPLLYFLLVLELLPEFTLRPLLIEPFPNLIFLPGKADHIPALEEPFAW